MGSKIAPPQESLVLHTHTGKSLQSFAVFSSECTGTIKAKVHRKPIWAGGTKVYSPNLGHLNKKAAVPIYGKKTLKTFSGTKKANDAVA